MATTSKQVRDCNTCADNVQGRGLDDAPPNCWDCASSDELVHWRPIEIVSKLSPEEYIATLTDDKPKSALETQVGGGHYKDLKIQPMEYSMANNLNACQHTVVKYVTRYKTKAGKQDLLKARHTIDLLIQLEYGSEE